MSAATDTTPRTTDGDVAADVFPKNASGSEAGPTAASGPKESSSLAFEWLRLLLATLARTGLILAVSMAAWASVPALWGWEPTTVMSGSMEPAISTGDVVVVRPMDATEYKPNRVVLVDNPDNPELLRLHRIVESNESGFLILRGDANNDNDATPVAPAAVHGIGFLNIPYVGLPIYWIQTAQWLKVIAVVGAFIFMCWASTLDRDLHRSKHRANPPTRGTGRGGRAEAASDGGLETLGLAGNKQAASATMQRTRSTTPGRRSARLGAAVVVSALVLGSVPVAAQAAFTATARNAGNVFTGALSCGATMLADGPTSLYQFDADTGSTVVDSVSPGTGNGSFQGTRTFSATPCAGDSGRSARFDGLTNSITTPGQNMAAPTMFTYEMWFRTPQGSTNSGKLMSFGVTPALGQLVTQDNRVLYLLSNGTLRFGIESNSANRLTTSVGKDYRDGNWHHVAVTLKSNNGAMAESLMELYVDGVRTNNARLANAIPPSTGSWTVGSGPAGSWTLDRPPLSLNASFAGEIDNVAIYNGKVIDKSILEARYSGNRVPMNRP